MGLDPYPGIPVVRRQAHGVKQFIPGLRIQDRTPKLCIGPDALAPEVRCVKLETSTSRLTIRMAPAELAFSPSFLITSRQFEEPATASINWASGHVRSIFDGRAMPER